MIKTTNDTICAISTPHGVGGIAVARVSGNDAIAIASKIWRGRPLAGMQSHTVRLGTVVDSLGNQLDSCVATVYHAPKSFTGDNVVEFAVHGSRFVQRELLNSLVAAGARLALPGEFTRRAFAAGKMDLAEAEAVADIIASSSRAAHRVAMSHMRGHYSARLNDLRNQLLELASLLELELDFSEEEVEFASRQRLLDIARNISAEVRRMHGSFAAGAAIKDGIPVAIIGKTNAGKSSLLNIIIGDDRAIVSDIHGTTRDIVEDTIEIGDYLFRFCDTAGLRETTDTIERLGIERSYNAARKARIIILVIDITSPVDIEAIKEIDRLIADSDSMPYLVIALNKTDLISQPSADSDPSALNAIITTLDKHIAVEHKYIPVSAASGAGIDTLRETLTDIASQSDTNDHTLVTNARHAEALMNASQSIDRVIEGLTAGISGDFVAQDLRETLHHLGAITGAITDTDILASIFSRFCIGK